MAHTPASLGYRLTFADGTVLALSGDTDVCDGALSIARGADHAVLEASFPEAHAVRGHLTPERAASIAAEAGARHLILSHFYPEVDVEQARAAARARFAGRLTIAEDGLRVALRPVGAAA
jgi:ribonuclease BN (tRNA processing enzyme)